MLKTSKFRHIAKAGNKVAFTIEDVQLYPINKFDEVYEKMFGKIFVDKTAKEKEDK